MNDHARAIPSVTSRHNRDTGRSGFEHREGRPLAIAVRGGHRMLAEYGRLFESGS